jgi:glycosyltransferase involved in cell wall biosynthesis
MYRVLMIAPTPFFADRGCHVRILGEVHALTEAGCTVTLCTYHNGRDVPGVRTVRIPHVPWYTKLEAGPSHHKYYLDLMLLGRSLATGLRERPDVVHAHLHEGAFIGRFVSAALRRPMVFDYQGSLTDELAAHGYARPGGPVLKAMGAVERWVDAGAAMVLCSTTRASERLRQRLGNKRVTTVLDGVDASVFKPLSEAERVAARRRFALAPDGVTAVFVGVLAPHQGIDLLLEHLGPALDAVPRLQVVIAGFPNESYRRRAAHLRLGDRLMFTGRLPHEETASLCACADIALTPKVSATEGNLKVANYLACGLPVVAFDTPVNHELAGELGVYAPLGDGPAFVEALVALARAPERRAALGAQGRRRAVQSLSWQHRAEQLVDVYRAVGAVPSRRTRPVAAPVA